MTPGRVYDALDSAVAPAVFWARSAAVGDGRILLRFGDGTTCASRILERRPPRIFALDYLGGPAVFELSPDGAHGTDLLLTHEGVPAVEWIETHAGWLNVLRPLKAWVVHGADLRHHDPGRSRDRGFVEAG